MCGQIYESCGTVVKETFDKRPGMVLHWLFGRTEYSLSDIDMLRVWCFAGYTVDKMNCKLVREQIGVGCDNVA